MKGYLAKLKQHISLGALKQIASSPAQIFKLPAYYHDLKTYRAAEMAKNGCLSPLRIYPCLNDRLEFQWAHGNYFYQDCWAARQVFKENPEWGVDIGSTVLLVGILSQFKPWTSVDIRPIECDLGGAEVQNRFCSEFAVQRQ